MVVPAIKSTTAHLRDIMKDNCQQMRHSKKAPHSIGIEITPEKSDKDTEKLVKILKKFKMPYRLTGADAATIAWWTKKLGYAPHR
jgi:hypothetical protein